MRAKIENNLAPERIAEILQRLEAGYPKAECALYHQNAWELLVATILSAQCTDARVNMVTPELFRKFPTPTAMAEASLPAIEEEIRSTGFYHNKARSISGAAKKIVGSSAVRFRRRWRNCLRFRVRPQDCKCRFGSGLQLCEGVVVDTHVLRLSNGLGLTRATDPKKVEQDLMKIIPKDHWIQFSHELIHHGRQVCISRNPRCVNCTLETLCHSPDKTWNS